MDGEVELLGERIAELASSSSCPFITLIVQPWLMPQIMNPMAFRYLFMAPAHMWNRALIVA